METGFRLRLWKRIQHRQTSVCSEISDLSSCRCLKHNQKNKTKQRLCSTKEDRRTNLSSLFSWLKTKHYLMRSNVECPGRESRVEGSQAWPQWKQASALCILECSLWLVQHPRFWFKPTSDFLPLLSFLWPQILTGEAWHSCLGWAAEAIGMSHR